MNICFDSADGSIVFSRDTTVTPNLVKLARGAAEATVYTCDLSHEYVTINADYRS